MAENSRIVAIPLFIGEIRFNVPAEAELLSIAVSLGRNRFDIPQRTHVGRTCCKPSHAACAHPSSIAPEHSVFHFHAKAALSQGCAAECFHFGTKILASSILCLGSYVVKMQRF
jgi:hypothetical protein